jgi:MFS family permease
MNRKSTPVHRSTRPLLPKLLPILGITFLDILGFSILLPIMPYFVQHFGAPKIAVGLLFTSFMTCQFIGGPIWGYASDLVGRKKVLIVSQIGATIGWTTLAFAPTLSWVFLARIIEGFSGGNISVTQAYVADRVEPAQRARAFGYVGASFSAGIVLGPATGGLLLAKYGYATPFLLAASLQVLTLLATVFFLPESVAKKAEGEKTASLSDIPRYLADPAVRPVLTQKFAYALGLFSWFASYALVLQAQLGYGPTQTSFVFAGSGVISILLQLGVTGNLSERIGTRATSSIGFASAVLYFLYIPHVRDALSLAFAVALLALGSSIANVTMATLLMEAAPERARGAVVGVAASLESIAGIVMPTISTGTLTLYGSSWTAAISAFFMCVALTLGLWAQRRRILDAFAIKSAIIRK